MDDNEKPKILSCPVCGAQGVTEKEKKDPDCHILCCTVYCSGKANHEYYIDKQGKHLAGHEPFCVMMKANKKKNAAAKAIAQKKPNVNNQPIVNNKIANNNKQTSSQTSLQIAADAMRCPTCSSNQTIDKRNPNCHNLCCTVYCSKDHQYYHDDKKRTYVAGHDPFCQLMVSAGVKKNKNNIKSQINTNSCPKCHNCKIDKTIICDNDCGTIVCGNNQCSEEFYRDTNNKYTLGHNPKCGGMFGIDDLKKQNKK